MRIAVWPRSWVCRSCPLLVQSAPPRPTPTARRWLHLAVRSGRSDRRGPNRVYPRSHQGRGAEIQTGIVTPMPSTLPTASAVRHTLQQDHPDQLCDDAGAEFGNTS